jgi:hypothetical protein
VANGRCRICSTVFGASGKGPWGNNDHEADRYCLVHERDRDKVYQRELEQIARSVIARNGTDRG